MQLHAHLTWLRALSDDACRITCACLLGININCPLLPFSMPTKITPNQTKIQAIVDQEFNTEIFFKNKDLHTIEQEIGKAEAQLALLKKHHENATQRTSNSEESDIEPSEYSKKYTKLLAFLASAAEKQNPKTEYGAVQSKYMTTRSQASALRPVARMRPSSGSVEFRYQQQNKCICRRLDNVLVSLECPKCHKTDFLLAQGFINHCRIAHMVEILSPDHAAMTCGTLLPKSEQDDGGLEALESLEKHGLDPQVNLNRPDLEEYAKTTKEDPLALVNMESMRKKDKKEERKEKRRRLLTEPLNYGHLEKFLRGKVDGFEDLVGAVTERVDVDLGDLEEEEEKVKPEGTPNGRSGGRRVKR